MSDGDFQEMGQESDTFPGPRAFLVSGYDPDDLAILRTFLDAIGYEDAPLKPCTAEQIGDSLERILSDETQGVPLGAGKLPQVLVFSGLALADVQTVMGRFSKVGVPRPIFATTTPTNLSFTAKVLLRHLLEEQKMARAASTRSNA